MSKKRFKSYWSETGTYEAIVPLIKMDFDGLKKAIIEMLSGSSVEVGVTSFQNDTVSFVNKDDVLTYLIHLGYLGYDQNTETAFIPNEEIRQELIKATRRTQWNELFDHASIEAYTGTILLVGVNYNKSSKEHQCEIEKYEKLM